MSVILPIADELFDLSVLHEAGRLVRDDPANLTHRHLQHVAVYSPSDAITYARKRDEALARRTKALEAAVLPAPVPSEPPFVQAFLELLADQLRERDDRIKSLEAKVEVLEAAAVKTQGAPITAIRSWPAA